MVKLSKEIAQQLKVVENLYIVDIKPVIKFIKVIIIKSVITEHPKTYCKLSKTIKRFRLKRFPKYG